MTAQITDRATRRPIQARYDGELFPEPMISDGPAFRQACATFGLEPADERQGPGLVAQLACFVVCGLIVIGLTAAAYGAADLFAHILATFDPSVRP